MSQKTQEKYLRLKEIAEIFKGYPAIRFNDDVEANNGEEVTVLGWKQVKDYVMTQKVDDRSNKIKIGTKYNKNIKYMTKGDIVLPVFTPSKSSTEIIYIEEEPKQKYAYNESVLVIRVTDMTIDSKYIYIICNYSNSIQNGLLKIRTGTALPRITKEMLSNILIIKRTEEERKQIIEEYTNILKRQEEFLKKINEGQTVEADKSAVIWFQNK